MCFWAVVSSLFSIFTLFPLRWDIPKCLKLYATNTTKINYSITNSKLFNKDISKVIPR